MSSSEQQLKLALLSPFSGGWPVAPKAASAVQLGLQEVARLQLLPGYNITWTVGDSSCNGNHGKSHGEVSNCRAFEVSVLLVHLEPFPDTNYLI